MFNHPDVLFLQATEYRRKLEADAARYRLLAAARQRRRDRRAASRRR